MLLPVDMREWLPEDDLVFVVLDAVATLDLGEFRSWHFLLSRNVPIEMGPGRHPQSTAIFLYFLGPEGFTYEYSFGVRRIEDDAAWVPRTFDPDEPGPQALGGEGQRGRYSAPN